MNKLYFVFFSLVLFIISCARPEQQVDLIITNAALFDGIDYHEKPANIYIRGSRIVDVKYGEDTPLALEEQVEVLDAAGKFVMPGLIEGHGHFLSFGEGLSNLSLSEFETWDEVVDAVAAAAEELPKGAWIEGRGWHQEKLKERPQPSVQGYPIHESLSAATPDNPVYLTHASGHAAFVNAKAMEMVGVSKETTDPIGGRYLRNPNGTLTGVLEENAMAPFRQFVKSTKKLEEVWAQALGKAGSACLEYGITSFQDAASTCDQVHWLKARGDENKLPVRLYLMVYDSLQKMNDNLETITLRQACDSFLSCHAVKSFFDGALGSRGAWLLEDYTDQPGYLGQNTLPLDDLNAYAQFCKENNYQYCVHAIGDRANREVLNVFEDKMGKKSDGRWRIEHAQHVDPADQTRFAELDVIASMQPVHCTSDAPFVVARLGEKRAREGAYVWRSLLDKNAKLALGTDVPVEPMDPFANMYAALTRKRPGKNVSFFEDQILTRQEVLKGYTYDNAYAAFEEKFKGKIEPGYLADIIIVDRNLMTCAEDAVPGANVLTTVLDGKVVFNRK